MIRQSGLPVLDADAVVRDLLEPGSPLLAVVVDAFGAAVLTPSGVYDRQFVARVIFSDESARRRLNSIIHPAVGRRLREFLDEQDPDATAAFVAIPLMRPEHRVQLALDEVWVLEVSPDEALRRLVAGRGMSEEDARARLRAQLDNEARRALSDVVLDNSGTPEHLRAQLEELLGRGV